MHPAAHTRPVCSAFTPAAAAAECFWYTLCCCLALLLQPPSHNTSGEASAFALPGMQDHNGGAAVPAAAAGEGGHPLYFSRAATMKLSSALCSLKALKVRVG